MKKNAKRLPLFLVCVLFSSQAFAAPNLAIDITRTSLEELMNIKISSLSKKSEAINKAPAAVYVLTNDEIRRSGARHVAEALRYVPGVEVAKIDAGRWAISVRGFNGRTANKLLVMIDGRSIYSSFFSGVLWEEKTLGLIDVERIEVVRGPGGSVWGSNAVNGVINIVTKNAVNTTGTVVDASAGNEQAHTIYLRHGWRYSDNGAARVYLKSQERQDSGGAFQVDDDSRQLQGGFRLDQKFSNASVIQVSGDVYVGEIGQRQDAPNDGQRHRGHNLNVHVSHKPTDNVEHQFLSYYDATDLDTRSVDDQRHTLDMEYRYHKKRRHHASLWGVGYRSIHDKVETVPEGWISPEKETDKVLNAFFQEDVSFLQERAHLIVGAKYERNDYADPGWFPSVRASYSPQSIDGLMWFAWSKAQRIPTRLETDITLPGLNGESFDAERLAMTEFGWRQQWRKASVDIAAFYGEYDDLLSLEDEGIQNNIGGYSRGVELSANVQLNSDWLLRINYSHQSLSLSTTGAGTDIDRARSIENESPRHTLQVASLWDVSESWQVNAFVRYVDALNSRDESATSVDSYIVADFSLVWQVSSSVDLRLSGRHLGDGQHREWREGAPVSDEYSLSVSWEM